MQIFEMRKHVHLEDAQELKVKSFLSFQNTPFMRCVFSFLLKMATDSDNQIDLGSLCHMWGAANANALSPMPV